MSLSSFSFWATFAIRMSSIGMRRTSLIEWPAWLKCSDTGVVVLSFWWFRIERRCSPKRSKSWRLVSPMYWWHLLHSIRYMRFLRDQASIQWTLWGTPTFYPESPTTQHKYTRRKRRWNATISRVFPPLLFLRLCLHRRLPKLWDHCDTNVSH